MEPSLLVRLEMGEQSDNGEEDNSDRYEGGDEGSYYRGDEFPGSNEESLDNGCREENKPSELITDTNGTYSEGSGGDVVENELENELEYKVVHFLAETSTYNNKKKKKKKKKSRSSKEKTEMLKCSRCSATFRYQSTLSYHMKSDCGTKIILGKELVKKNNSKEAVVCDVCKKKLCSRTSLMVHMRIHTGERPFECAHCGRKFFQKAHLRDHLKSLHSPGRYLCRVCNSTYPDRSSLDKHLRSHFPDECEKYQCQACDKRYGCRSSLVAHLGSVHGIGDKAPGAAENGEGQMVCGACPKIVSSRSELRKHRALCHRPGPSAATCQHCGLVLPSIPIWRCHIRRVHKRHGPTAPRCPVCPRTFSSTYDLRIHLRSHTGERPFVCTLCGRGFARKSTLDVHLTLHTGRKDYACPECGAAFNRKSKLDVHMAEHYNTSVQCAECNKVFKCKSYLASHLKIHEEGDGRYICSGGCGRVFRSRRGLKYHRRSCGGVLVLGLPVPSPHPPEDSMSPDSQESLPATPE